MNWHRLRHMLAPRELRLLSLKFQDRRQEQIFQIKWIRATRGLNYLWGACAIIFYVIMTVVTDHYTSHVDNNYFWFRIIIGVPLLIGLTAYKEWGRYTAQITMIYFLICAYTIFSISLIQFYLSAERDSVVLLLEMAAIFVFAQHFSRILFVWNLMFSVPCSTVTIIAIYLKGPKTNLPFLPVIVTVVVLTLTGLFSCYSREVFVRRNFATMRNLERQNERANKLAEEAQGANEAKSRFLATVSHELRTPLNAILGYSEMINLGIAERLGKEKISEYASYIHDSGANLLKLVNQILHFTKSELIDRTVKPEILDVVDRLQGIAAQLQPLAAQSGSTIQLNLRNDLPTLIADPDRLRQMVTNLATNALKFSPAGANIDISAQQLNDNSLVIEVRDFGIGMDPLLLEYVLEPFTQLDDGLNRINDGLGIGLPLTKSLMEAHGGRLELESKPGKGTLAKLIFPPEAVKVREPKVA
ncbi:MAG: HAMP domain-containing histidine kinase [Rhodospirillaceae bacterium]|nr:HAMP domain-containing histidine kinase [Rhodospirillaceae bacterium]